MSIAHEFFKDEKPAIGGIEDQILFFIDNYAYMIKVFRIITLQLEVSQQKVQNAHAQLKRLRAIKDGWTQQTRKISDQEKLEMEEKMSYYTKMREEPDVIYWYGEPMTIDEATAIITKWKRWLKVIEPLDAGIRKQIAASLKKGIRIILTPLRIVAKFATKRSKNQALDAAHSIIEEFPDDVFRKVMESVNININEHIPTIEVEK